MIIEFTVHSLCPLTFKAEVSNSDEAWRLLAILGNGQKYPVSHVVKDAKENKSFPIIMRHV